MPVTAAYRPEPAFAALGPEFADPVEPAAFPEPTLRHRDAAAAARIGLEALTPGEWEAAFARFEPLPDNQTQPLAMRYHGHQFRTYNPQIGDGRGFLFAQMRDGRGRLLDIGTKGSGQTPYSRSGDGRMTLQSGVREAIAGRMLTALGVPSCAILSLFETGEALTRYDEPSPTRGAVMARLQHSHVRIGTFQRHAAHSRHDLIEQLLEHCIAVYYPHLVDVPAEDRAQAFLAEVTAANARLAARWMAAGYVHAVLNSDNMTVTGESFDYGPFRFLPVYEPGFTAAYFDEGGLYAYARQPEATLWNLTRLAETLAELATPDALEAELERFRDLYREAFRAAICARLGVEPAGVGADEALLTGVFGFLRASMAPWEGFFFDWFGGAPSHARALDGPRARHYRGSAFGAFRAALDAHAPAAPTDHAYFNRQAPFSPTIDVLRATWRAIEEDDDWTPFQTALADADQAGEAYRLG